MCVSRLLSKFSVILAACLLGVHSVNTHNAVSEVECRIVSARYRQSPVSPISIIPEGENNDIIIFPYEARKNFVTSQVLERFPEIRRLHFNTSNITDISKSNFLGANDLQYLDLSNNWLQQIPFQVFSEIWNLDTLLLACNHIHTIEDYAFDGLLTLQNLDLRKNHLRKITRLMFANLPSLQFLDLSSNFIGEIEEGALNLPKLEQLYLNANKLTSFLDSTFAQTPQLFVLRARNNDLQHVNNALDHLQKLAHLSLADNIITDLDLKKLAKLENLQWLQLENNPIKLDSLIVSADDIAASKSQISELNLGHGETENDPVFQKLKLFPNLNTVYLARITFKNFDLEAIRSGGLTGLTQILVTRENFDENRLNETVKKLSMRLERIEPYWFRILINK